LEGRRLEGMECRGGLVVEQSLKSTVALNGGVLKDGIRDVKE